MCSYLLPTQPAPCQVPEVVGPQHLLLGRRYASHGSTACLWLLSRNLSLCHQAQQNCACAKSALQPVEHPAAVTLAQISLAAQHVCSDFALGTSYPAVCSIGSALSKRPVRAVGYCMGGIQLYWFSPFNTTETLDIYNIVTGIGFGGGSVCFFLGSILLLARQVRILAFTYILMRLPPPAAGVQVNAR